MMQQIGISVGDKSVMSGPFKETYLNPKTLRNMDSDPSNSKTRYQVADFLKNNYNAIGGALKISKNSKRQ